jgi:hypothetical protein
MDPRIKRKTVKRYVVYSIVEMLIDQRSYRVLNLLSYFDTEEEAYKDVEYREKVYPNAYVILPVYFSIDA